MAFIRLLRFRSFHAVFCLILCVLSWTLWQVKHDDDDDDDNFSFQSLKSRNDLGDIFYYWIVISILRFNFPFNSTMTCWPQLDKIKLTSPSSFFLSLFFSLKAKIETAFNRKYCCLEMTKDAWRNLWRRIFSGKPEKPSPKYLFLSTFTLVILIYFDRLKIQSFKQEPTTVSCHVESFH